ncbi:MAG: ATP-dependent Clp protease ATP-binding subunit [Oscillospiraceae bacterium]
MFKFTGFTPKANSAINIGINEASLLGHTYVGSEHILFGLAKEGSGVAYAVMRTKGITADMIDDILIKTIGRGLPSTNLTPDNLTPRGKKILEMSIAESKQQGQSYVGTEHIFLSILKEKDCFALKFLNEFGVDTECIYKNITDALGYDISSENDLFRKTVTKQVKPMNSKTPSTDKFSVDLTELARQNLLDPVIGRKSEIESLLQILSRRTKNNPCLIGEAGVGKTAIIEALAQKIISDEVPDVIKNKRVLSLDLTAMVAGTKYRGDFEERIKNVLAEVTAAKNVILFIDEIHNIMGIGSAEGAIDAANILKPQLARGKIQLVGATTIEEYRKHIEKDSALERRFQSVLVKEPTEEDSIEILKGIKYKYEEHHKIVITNEAIKSAVEMSTRYLPEKFLPDKAIDLIDEASARAKIMKIEKTDTNDYELELLKLKKDKESAVINQNFNLAASIKNKEVQLNEKIRESKSQENTIKSNEITTEDIAYIISQKTGIEVTEITKEQSEKLINLENRLNQNVIGQEMAVSSVARAIKRGRIGLKDPNKPIGSFLFLGPTGVGKTELSKALSRELFGTENAMLRFDMSEYMEKHSVSKLIGSPPGYIGYDEGGQLTEKIRRRPYAVVLFDEIEKAHTDVLNLLLQIMDDGILTDSQGRKVSFKNAIIIMTSNIGAQQLADMKYLGFTAKQNSAEKDDETKNLMLKELKSTFKPEFINRVDEIAVFRRLSSKDIAIIAKKSIDEVGSRLNSMEISLDYSDAVIDKIANEAFDSSYGARPVRRKVQVDIEDEIADKILNGEIKIGDCVRCTVVDNKIISSVGS